MKKKRQAIFIAATGQNVGKTTLCLGIIAGLLRRYEKVGFLKPVGQQHAKIDDDTIVDKDAVLFKKHFNLSATWNDMSPVIIPHGFTRDYLDGRISESGMIVKITKSFDSIFQENDYTIVEGTGHVGVGSIVGLNNAKVASILGLDMVIIASGGLGSAHDELALNLSMCEKYGVSVRGVILNRVQDDKRSMIIEYFPRSLTKWEIPLIGCVPYNAFLSRPTLRDFESLFQTSLLSGERHHYRHFEEFRLVAGSLEAYLEEIVPNELVITPATREDIILATIEKHNEALAQGKDLKGAMMLTGRHPPSDSILEAIRAVDIPTLYAPLCSYDTMKMLTSHIAKIRTKDTAKIQKAIQLVEENINFDALTRTERPQIAARL